MSVLYQYDHFGPILDSFGLLMSQNLSLIPKFVFNTQYMSFHMKNNALLFKWSRKIVLTKSISLIVCFGYLGLILAQFRPKMAKYDPVKPVLKFSCIICTQRMKMSEIADLSLFYIHLTILDLFWTNFGSVLDYLWAKLGLQYPIRELSHQKIMLNSLLE